MRRVGCKDEERWEVEMGGAPGGGYDSTLSHDCD